MFQRFQPANNNNKSGPQTALYTNDHIAADFSRRADQEMLLIFLIMVLAARLITGLSLMHSFCCFYSNSSITGSCSVDSQHKNKANEKDLILNDLLHY